MAKVEGRTQLVGYAYRHGLVKTLSEGRKMGLEDLRRAVEAHRNQVHQDAEATNANKERT